MKTYDAGLLNDFGGGNVEWWHDYIRSELARAHDFYSSMLAQIEEAAEKEAAEKCFEIVNNIPLSANNYGGRVDYARLKIQEISEAIVMEFNL